MPFMCDKFMFFSECCGTYFYSLNILIHLMNVQIQSKQKFRRRSILRTLKLSLCWLMFMYKLRNLRDAIEDFIGEFS